MNKIQYKKNNGLKVFALIFSLIGFILFIITLVLFIKTLIFNQKSEVVEVTIETCVPFVEKKANGEETISYQVYVNYFYNGSFYEHKLITGITESLASGDTLKARVNTQNNEDIRYMTTTSTAVILCMIIGLAMFIGFGYLFINQSISQNEYKEIIKNGRKVDAKVVKIYPEKNVYNNKYQYYKLDCESMEKIFTSKPFKNGEYITEGDVVYVYYTSLKKNKYYVDVESIEVKEKKTDDNWTFK